MLDQDVTVLLLDALEAAIALAEGDLEEACFRARAIATRAEQMRLSKIVIAALNLEVAIKSGFKADISAASDVLMDEVNLVLLDR